MDTLHELFSFLTNPQAMIRWGGFSALAAIVFTETGLMVGFKREHLIRTRLFYEKHGGETIVIARYVCEPPTPFAGVTGP